MATSEPRSAQMRDELSALVQDARHALDRDLLWPTEPSHQEVLAGLWELVSTELTSTEREPAATQRVATLVGLLGRIRAAEAELVRKRLEEQSAALARVSAVTTELSSISSVDALLAAAPEAACRLGFDRALVSTVDGTWRLETMCVVRDPRWAEEIVAIGREDPPLLNRSLVENDSVEGVQTTLVHQVQENPRVNRPLAEITRSSSYGIAPLLLDGEVVGLLHGDCYHQQRPVTAHDQSVLSAFAAGLSQNLARVTVLDRVAAARRMLDDVGRWRPASAASASAAAAHDDHDVLTRREAQIMRLMAEGDSNGKIARRLVISESTVKTHVTRILRKLQARSRAEAVAVWLRST